MNLEPALAAQQSPHLFAVLLALMGLHLLTVAFFTAGHPKASRK